MISLTLLLVLLPLLTNAQCFNLNSTSYCYDILDYHQVYIPPTTCQTEIDTTLLPNHLAWDMIPTNSCRTAIAYLTCATTYPPCDQTTSTPIPLCDNTCKQLLSNSVCNTSDFEALQLVNGSWLNLTDCSKLPSTGCYPGPTDSTITSFDFSALHSPYRPSCHPYPSDGICAPFINYTVYWSYDDHTGAENTVKNTIERLGALAPSCANAATKFICGIWYTGCNETVISDTLGQGLISQPVLPAPQCLSLCNDYLTACNQYLDLFKSFGQIYSCSFSFVPGLQLGLNARYCNNTRRSDFPFDFQPVYYPFNFLPPLSNMSMTTKFQTTCSMMEGAGSLGQIGCMMPSVDATEFPTYIGYVRHFSPNTSDLSPCELACPQLYAWSDSQWSNSEKIMYLTIPSFILTTYLLITWVVFPIKRKQQYNLAFISCIWLVSFVLTFAFAAVSTNPSNLRALRYISCKNQIEGYSMFGPPSYCVFQAFILYYFLLSGTCWWFIIIIDLYRKVVLEQRYTPAMEKRNVRIYHGYGWGLPSLSLILFLSTGGQLGGSNASIFLFCWIYTQRTPSTPFDTTDFDYVRDWLFWYGPIGIMGIIGFTLMMIVLYKIIKSTGGARANVRGVNVISLHARPLFFALAFFFVFFWFFVWRVQYSKSYNAWTLGVQRWAECVATTGGKSRYKPCGEIPRIDGWAWYGFHFFLSMQGIILTLTWGSQMDNITLWKDFIESHSIFSYHSGTSKRTENADEKSKNSKNSQISREFDASGSGALDRSPRGTGIAIDTPSKAVEMSGLPSPSSPASPFDFSPLRTESASSSAMGVSLGGSSTERGGGSSVEGQSDTRDHSGSGSEGIPQRSASIRSPSLSSPLPPQEDHTHTHTNTNKGENGEWNTNPLLHQTNLDESA